MCAWDHSSRREFYDYYAEESQSHETLQRFRSIRDSVLRIVEQNKSETKSLDVVDIGCGAGTQCMTWAELGYRVHGLDVNRPLLDLARKRADDAGYRIDYRTGSAMELPWADGSMDVCLAIELLEHVAEWRACLNEFIRILRPGGVLVVTTTNRLCPVQQEFTLPLYSWYPGPVKRHFERLAKTTRPALANFATYPAVNWFSFYSLRDVLAPSGFQCFDRFDIMDLSKKSPLAKYVVSSLRVPFLKWLAHVATPGTIIIAKKRTGRTADPAGRRPS